MSNRPDNQPKKDSEESVSRLPMLSTEVDKLSIPDNRDLFDKALLLVKEGLKVTPYEFAQTIIAFAKANKELL